MTTQNLRLTTHTRAAWAASLGGIAFVSWLLFRTGPSTTGRIWLVGAAFGLLVSYALARRADGRETWFGFLRRTWDIHALGAALLYWLAVQHLFSNGITSDGCLYFAHLRSVIFDGDLQIDPELAVLGLPVRPHHIVSLGPGVIWAPLYLAVAGVDWLRSVLGAVSTPDDVLFRTLGGSYVRAALIGSFLTASAGLVALHLRLRREFGATSALIGSLLLFGATPLVYYAVYEPSMTHAASFGLVALFLVTAEAWMREDTPSPARAVTLGVLIGLAFLVRPQNALFGLFPIAFAWTRASGASGWKPEGRAIGWIVAAALPFVGVQGLFWAALMTDRPFELTGDSGYLRLLDPQLLDVLFSSWHGLFSWTPVAYVAFVGALFYVGRDRVWGLAALAVFVAMWWVNGSAEDWSGGWAFGGRRFTSTLAALAPGLALAVATVRRRPLLLVAPLVLLVIQWNFYLMVQYNKAMIPKDQPVSFGALVRQQAELIAEPPFTYPFAFPANAWFGWRHGVPPDRYDLLSSVANRPMFERDFGEGVVPYLLEGWDGATEPTDSTARRMTAPTATLIVPLDPATGGVVVRVRARAVGERAASGRVTVSVGVNGTSIGRFAAGPEWSDGTITMAADAARRVWQRGYNRLALSVEGDRAGAATATGGRPGIGLEVQHLRVGSDSTHP